MKSIYQNFIIIILFFLILELSLIVFFNYFFKQTKRFYNDDTFIPKYNNIILKKFYKVSYSSKLGWDNHIKNNENKKLLRKKNKKIFTFGDSYVFGKFSDNVSKWQYHLNKNTNLKVLNYGVNNHGLDQSFLKIMEYKNHIKSNIVIVGFVPETILRISTSWKHFYELGNIYAFKPRFELVNKKLVLKKNPMKKNFKIDDLYKLVSFLKKTDPGYKLFYKNNLIKFPTTYFFLKKFNYILKLSTYLVLYKKFRFKKYKKNILNLIVSKNIELSHKFYKKGIRTDLIETILKKLNKECDQRKSKLYIVIFPQIFDLKFRTKKYYIDFYKKIAKKNNLKIIDLAQHFNKIDFEKYYLNDEYGGHLNQKGNKLAAKIIYKNII